MSGPDPSATTRSADPRRQARTGWWRRARQGVVAIGTLALNLALGLVLLILVATEVPLTLPRWATDRVEMGMNRGLGGAGIAIGQTVVRLGRHGTSRIALRNVRLRDGGGARLGQIDRIEADFAVNDLLAGRRMPSELSLSGAQITLRRSADGAFALGLGGARPSVAGTLAEVLDAVDQAFSSAPLDRVKRIALRDLTVTLEDARTGRVWQATDGTLRLVNTPGSVGITLFAAVFNGTERLAPVQMSFALRKGSGAAVLSASVQDAAARDIAAQEPVLTALSVLDAPVSGSIRTVIGPAGTVDSLAATLEIGAGAIRPAGAASALPITQGRLYLSYDPGRARLDISDLVLRGDGIVLSGRGEAYLRDFHGPRPGTILAQMQFGAIEGDPEGVLAHPVTFDGAWVDVRLTLDPFRAEFGQIVLADGPRRLRAEGSVSATDAGWTVDVEARASDLAPDRLIALWPLGVARGTRDWLARNVLDGRLSRVEAAVRVAPGDRPAIGLSFDYADARVRAMPDLPPVAGAAGYGAMTGDGFALRVDHGRVGGVDVARSTFRIADIFEKPAQGTLGLKASGPLRSVLTVLDRKPFEVLQRSGRTADIADARAEMTATASFPMRKLTADDVDWRADGRLTDMRSGAIVPGRTLTADALDVTVVPDALTVAGPLRLDGVPADIRFTLPLGAAAADPARVTGTVAITPATLDAFGIALPEGTLAGSGSGDVSVVLARGADPELHLASTLEGLTLRLPALGWTKPAGQSGSLGLDVRLGAVASVDRLALSAPGLSATGSVTLGEDGGFRSAQFDRVTAGTWLDAPVRLEARGAGLAPRVRVTGGTVALQRRPEGGGGGSAVPIEVALDSLAITDSIAIRPFEGSFTATTGLSGAFTGRVNGGARVRGRLDPEGGGTAVRVSATNAGRVLRDAGLFKSLDEGSLDLLLTPLADGTGYDGQVRIKDTRLRDQPVLVDMLDAVSVVGLIDQIRGPGILFSDVEGRFRLLSDRVILDQGSAVGASLGVSLDGVYDLARRNLDMGGVVSPIYMLNSIGQIFTRRGEGLFGFTFRLAGDPASPQVSVNPLSILTPGLFREIFRRPPPARSQ